MGIGHAVVQDSLFCLDIRCKKIGSIYEGRINNGLWNVFYFEGSYDVVCLGSLAYVILMINWFDVVEDSWGVLDVGVDCFFEEVGRGYIYFWGAGVWIILVDGVEFIVFDCLWDVVCVEYVIEMLYVVVDLIFVADILLFRRGVIFKFWLCPDDLFHFIEFFLEGLGLYLFIFIGVVIPYVYKLLIEPQFV